MDDRVAALEQRVADIEAVLALSLAALRREREAADPDVQARRADEATRDQERRDALARMKLAMNSHVRFDLRSARQALEHASRPMESDVAALRRSLSKLEEAAEALRPHVAADQSWEDGRKNLAEAAKMIADARAVVARFDDLPPGS